ncbi:MAG: hypothetical protein KGJ86_07315 [Chloroflexota bacterium]|nr:hypothetical protein [Chloroflexota bacterium]
MATITLLDPTAEPKPVPRPLAQRLSTLDGKTIGFLNNSKPNVEQLFDTIAEQLQQRFRLAAVIRKIKPAAPIPAEREILDELARTCDAAVLAVCD